MLATFLRFELPVATAGLVIRVLRGFGRALGKGVPGVRMPDRLVEPGFELRLYVYDGEHLVLSGRDSGARKTVLLGANIAGARGTDASPRVVRRDELPAKFEARLEIDRAGDVEDHRSVALREGIAQRSRSVVFESRDDVHRFTATSGRRRAEAFRARKRRQE